MPHQVIAAPRQGQAVVPFLTQANHHMVAAGAALHWLVPFEKNPIAKGWSDLPRNTLADLERSYRPNANIGVRLGEPSQIDGLYLHLIDLDVRDAERAAEAWSALLSLWPAARTFPSVASGSGGASRHIYFLTDRPFRKKKLVKSDGFQIVDGRKKRDWEIDFMGTGSQAVLPPSIHPDTRKPYRWERPLDLDFAALIQVDAETVAGWGADDAAPGDVMENCPLSIERAEVERILENLPPDWVEDRDTWLTTGQALHHQFEGSREGFDLWCEWSKRSHKFDLKDSKRVWRSFRGSANPVTLRSLGHVSLYDPDDFDDLPELTKPRQRLRFLTPQDCADSPAREYLIKGLVARQDVGCIFGAPGAGKSLIAPFLGYMVAQGVEAFGMRTKPGGVFYVAAEDPHGMRGRVKGLNLAHGDAPGFTMVEGVSQLLTPRNSMVQAHAPDLIELIEAVKEQRPALIFIDTLAMAFPGLEENSAEDMGRVVAVTRLLTRWGAAVILIHHDAKSEGGSPRGHSILNGALDMALHVKRDGEIIRGSLTKNRNGTTGRDIAFVIATEDGGTDEDGDTITLPRCNPLAGSAPKVERLSASADAALRVLERAGGRLSEGEWRSAMIDGREVSASDVRDNRRRAATRVIEKLIEQEHVKYGADGFYTTCDGFDDLPAQE